MKIILALTALALLTAGAVAGVIQPLFASDGTYLTYASAAVAVFGTVCSRDWLEWIVKHGLTIMLGLLGTVLGFWGALEGLSVDDDIVMQSGVSTALTTTVVGMVAHLYLVLIQRVSR